MRNQLIKERKKLKQKLSNFRSFESRKEQIYMKNEFGKGDLYEFDQTSSKSCE